MKLEELQRIYNDNFYNKLHKNYNYQSAKIILPIIFEYYKPNSIIDIGCGVGTWLRASLELGIEDIMGIDCNTIPEEELLIPRKYIQIDNLETHKNINNKKYDMVISLEVAEHLEQSASEHFVDTLVSYGNIILFSAAIPHQVGINHINCHPPKFWFDLFKKHNYICFDFRDKLMNIHDDYLAPQYPQNTLLYVHKDLCHIFDKYFYITKRPAFFYHHMYVYYIINEYKKYNIKKINYNWFNLLSIFNINFFSISNDDKYIRITILFLKITFKINNEIIDKIAWWIPVRKWREAFRDKF